MAQVGGRQQNGCVLVSGCIPKLCLRMLPACGCNGRSHRGKASLLYRIAWNPYVIEQNTTSWSEFKSLSVAIYLLLFELLFMLNLHWSRENECSWLIPGLLRSAVTGACKAWLQKQLLKSVFKYLLWRLFVVIYVISAVKSTCCPFDLWEIVCIHT